MLQPGVSQVYSGAVLEYNNIKATTFNGGVFFNDPSISGHGFEFPKGSSNHLIYASSFWFGSSFGGSLRLSAQTYNFGDDIFPGAIVPGTATDPGNNSSKEVYYVSKSQIDNHIANYNSGSYTMPYSIENWPAHGDVNLSLDYYLAPFVDVNSNGQYDPENGDYPLIRGDHAAYMILNDNSDVHASGGDALGIECHFMFYQYESNNLLENTVFLNLKVINRSTAHFPDFRVACFTDPDVGNSTDDYTGSDSTLKMMYAYNGNNNDGIYGQNPPAIGVLNLNQSMDAFGSYFGTAAGGLPSTPTEYWLNMDAKWKDGSSFTVGGNGYGGTSTTQYVYHGNPNNAGEWSEWEEGNTPGERRMFMATNQDTLFSGEQICLDYAFFVGSGGDHLENVSYLYNDAQEIQSFFNNQSHYICANYENYLSIEEVKVKEPKVYPIPSKGELNVDFEGNYDIIIHSMDGRIVFEKKNVYNNCTIFPNIQSGSYIMTILKGSKKHTQSLLIE